MRRNLRAVRLPCQSWRSRHLERRENELQTISTGTSTQHTTMATLFCHRATCIRSLASSTRAFPAVTPTKAAFSTTTSSTQPLKQLRLPLQPTRPSIICRIPPQTLTTTALRHASSAPAANSSSDDVLTWNRFFDLRKKRRFINLGASVVTALASITAFGPVVAAQDLDSWGAQVSGLDPFIVLGLSGIVIGGAGWLCGPSIGSGMFSLWASRRGWGKAISDVSHLNMMHMRVPVRNGELTVPIEREDLLRPH